MPDGFIITNGVLEQCLLKEPVITVPDGVIAIGEAAMKGGTSIEQVILPATVTEIRGDAFKGCRRLREINIPNAVHIIGDYAFHRCHSLKKIELPVAVQSLGNCVFLYCDSLEYISIPGVKLLGKQVFLNDISLRTLVISKELELNCICDVFTGCSKITEISFFEGDVITIENIIELVSGAPKLPSLVGAIAVDVFRMMELDGKTVLKFLTNLKHIELPEGIQEIGKSCFFDKRGIISVKLPASLMRIGSKAFRNCINLELIEFAGDDVQVEADAFKNCTTLRWVKLANGNQYELMGLADKEEERPELIQRIHSQILGNFQISGTELLHYFGKEGRVTIPEGITIIGERAFVGNEAIDRIILPTSIREIREEAFLDCLLLQTIQFPEGLSFIGKSAFEHCVKLIRIQLPESLCYLGELAFNRCKLLVEVQFKDALRAIRALTFYGCTSLKKVDFPEGLLEIGDMAFYKCSKLKEIFLPVSLKILGNNVFTASGVRLAVIAGELTECGTEVFSQCSKLKKMVFQQTVNVIGNKFAFGCHDLLQVELPINIKRIGRNAFEGSNFLKGLLPKGVNGTFFLDGSSYKGVVSVPEGITVIAGGAFYGNKEITKLHLPETLRSIGARAFCGCTSLQVVTLPKGITVLEEGTFAYCSTLWSVAAEGEVETIKASVFYGCEKLVRVSVSSVKYIGNNAFLGCINLDDLALNCSFLGEDVLGETAYLKKLLQISPLAVVSNLVVEGKACEGILIIPEGVIGISPFAFAGNELITELILPESLQEIGDYAFAGCKAMITILWKAPLTHFGKHAFEKCTSLKEIHYKGTTVGEGAFSFCTSLQSAVLEETERLERDAFAGCKNLIDCKCKEVRYIGERCFSGCESLSDVFVPLIKWVGAWAFWSCNAFKSMVFLQNVFIEEHAFEDCGQLRKLVVMGEIQFGSYAFSGCTAIELIQIGTECWQTVHYSVLTNKDVPDLVKRIYASAISCFRIDETKALYEYNNNGCYVLIPDGLRRIESEVFKEKNRISSLYIPKSVEYIGARAFHGTQWLEQRKAKLPLVIVNQIVLDGTACCGEAVIPAEVKLIAGWAFAGCLSLTKVRFLSESTKVEEYAFRNCICLEEIELENSSNFKLTNLLDRERPLTPIIKQMVLDCYNCFKMAAGGILVECTGNISEMMLPEGITELEDFVFQDSNLLSNIVVSKSLCRIGKGAFSNCKWLASVRQAVSVERVDEMAFSGCVRLFIIELSEKLQYIGKKAFENCTMLKTIEIPEGIEEIPERAFYRCQSLNHIKLPSSIKKIGKEAFAFCYELETIEFPSALVHIEARAFAWCKNLKYSIPQHVQADADAFCFCSL